MALIFAALAVFFGNLVKGVIGFGSALVVVPVLAWLWGPRDAIFLAAALDVVSGVALMPAVWAQLRWVLIAAVFLPMLAGQWLGTELLVTLPEDTVAIVLGIAVAIFAGDMVIRPVRPGRGELTDLPAERGPLFGFGAASGFGGGVMGGLVGAGGPPIVLFMRWFFADSFFRAQLIAVITLSAGSLTALIWYKLGTDATHGLRVVALLVPLLGGALFGQQLAGRIPRKAFGRAVGVVLLLAAAGLIASAVTGPAS